MFTLQVINSNAISVSHILSKHYFLPSLWFKKPLINICLAIESAPDNYVPQPKPTFEPVKTYQPAKATYQPIKSTYQPIKTTYQPIKSTYQPIKSTYQPIKSSYPEPIKATYQPIKSTYQPIAPTYPEAKSTLEPIKSTYQPSKPAYKPAVLEVQDTKKAYQPLPTEPIFKPSPVDYQPTPPTYQVRASKGSLLAIQAFDIFKALYYIVYNLD